MLVEQLLPWCGFYFNCEIVGSSHRRSSGYDGTCIADELCTKAHIVRGFIDVRQTDRERLTKRLAALIGSLHHDGVAGSGLEIHSDPLGNRDLTSGAIDRKSSTSVVGQRVSHCPRAIGING